MEVEEDLERGMSELEGTRAAHRDLGAVFAVREAHHQTDSLYWLDTLLQDLRYCRRGRVVLDLGVAMTRTVFTIDDSLLLNAVSFAEPHRLVELNRWGPSGDGPLRPVTIAENWRNERPLFRTGRDVRPRRGRLRWRCRAGDLCRARGCRRACSPSSASRPGLGRTFAPDEAGSLVAIVSYGAWADPRFGRDADIVGHPLVTAT